MLELTSNSPERRSRLSEFLQVVVGQAHPHVISGRQNLLRSIHTESVRDPDSPETRDFAPDPCELPVVESDIET